ncbi:hypothetical protein BH11ARM2_BH11ARM2_26090 [soil metagenome]
MRTLIWQNERRMASFTKSKWGEYDEWGNDISLLRYALSLTPGERLERNYQAARNVIMLRKAGEKYRAEQIVQAQEQKDTEASDPMAI